ncbi:hypothetical protein HIM_06216 [Hirsutella minnesotensis 3608]|uniref:MINDY deubiquitinase domain-containing protein n=1 Tax=Hirsutella minnesotensis 3608 TaxID=1043627 RepID=A0A0F7ZJH2_9HYPO|nr:hypothetical protein HIM_06216 [Hirsutella minnesotensis 3608]
MPGGAAHRSSPDPQRQPAGDEPSESVWRDPGAGKAANHGHGDVPAALRPGQAFNFGDDDDGNVWDEARKYAADGDRLAQVPESLKPGGSKAHTNPFLKRKPVPQTQEAPLDASFAQLGLEDAGQGSNPWQEAKNAPPVMTGPAPLPKPVLDAAEGDPWASSRGPTPPAKQPAAASPALISLPSEDEPSWDEDPRAGQGKMAVEAPPASGMSEELMDDQNVWDDLGALDRGKGKVLDLPAGQQAQLDDWNLIDADPSSGSPKEADESKPAEERPPLPPRTEGSSARWVPSRPPVDGKAETYQVKNIRWHDDKSESNPRTSPILIQNKNGPCPLVALVNALTLTTPAEIPDTALVQVLRSREQVSLNLLLDAVFDELMSPRRTSSEDALPDVTELYAFLQSLHTGMNVNPRFVPTPEMIDAYKHTSLTNLDPNERGELIPGTFENTMEMSLYATFSIPLIHGWLPSRTDPAYDALERRGASYEEVQNLLFHEEELEAKLATPQGLSEDEAQLYQDIMTIKAYLDKSATQLTHWGIDVIAKAMRPGTFAILFRNDHFSTLYCHPHTTRLLSLVTDAGYGTHEDVVWESLVDVNGERTEYLTGDFRVVGTDGVVRSGAADGAAGSSSGGRGDWTTVHSKRGKSRDDQGPVSPKHEQEDGDLALALQLQEEEDERHREEQARRRRESILSEQYIEQQAHRPAPVLRDARRVPSASSSARERRSSTSYAGGSAAVPRTSAGRGGHGPGRGQRPAGPPSGRRVPVGSGGMGGGGQGRDRDCVVM